MQVCKYNCQKWSLIIQGMVTNQPKDGHPTEGCILQTLNFALRLNQKNATKRSRQHARIQQRSSSTEGHLPPKVVFHQRSSSTEGRPPQKVVFHWCLSFPEGHLPPKVVFHQRSSSTEGCLPPKVVFHQRSSSTEGCLPPMVVIHQSSSSAEGCLSRSIRSTLINNFILFDCVPLRSAHHPSLSTYSTGNRRWVLNFR